MPGGSVWQVVVTVLKSSIGITMMHYYLKQGSSMENYFHIMVAFNKTQHLYAVLEIHQIMIS